MNMIELRNVSKSYRSGPVVKHVSLTVEKGERVVLFGPSGCGKSTVLLMITGLVVPESGEVLIGGETVTSGGVNRREPGQRGIGMVFQDLALWPHMTVAQNIEFGLKAKRMPSEERRACIQNTTKTVGLEGRLEARPSELSGGEQQRVALARALALEPRIVLMDEPLSSLDEALNLKLRSEILRLHKALGFTLVYVTHNRDEAQEIGSRIIHLRGGQILPA